MLMTSTPTSGRKRAASTYNGTTLTFAPSAIYEPIFNASTALKGIADGVILSRLIDSDLYLDLFMCGTVSSNLQSVPHTGI